MHRDERRGSRRVGGRQVVGRAAPHRRRSRPVRCEGRQKLLGIIPFGDKLRDYFAKYESSQKHIDAIIKALHNGQDELRKDNAALEGRRCTCGTPMQRLAQYIYVAEKLDAALVTKIAEVEVTDADRAKALREDVLFYVRQKHQDLLTQLAVRCRATWQST